MIDLVSFQPGQSDALNRLAQLALKEGGFYAGSIDGNFGPVSRSAWARWDAKHGVLRGSGVYGFAAQIVGADLVVRGVRATWFGGANDPYDNGDTASGISTRLHPDLLGCALPMDGFRLTKGSPLPTIPWRSSVNVRRADTGKSVTVILIDLGPSAPPHAHAAIDLTVGAFQALGGNLKEGDLTVDFTIPGGASRVVAD